MEDTVDKIKKHVIDTYLSWSDNFPICDVDKGNPKIQYDALMFSFEIPAVNIPTEEQSIKAFGNDLFHKIEQEEIMNFINNLGDPDEKEQFDGNLSSIEELVNDGWKHFFSTFGTPDIIIWSRKSCTEFAKKTNQGYFPKILNNSLTHVLVKDPSFSEIILLRKNRYDKIYPENRPERFILNINADPAGNTNTKFSGIIKHKILYDDEKEFVKIIID